MCNRNQPLADEVVVGVELGQIHIHTKDPQPITHPSFHNGNHPTPHGSSEWSQNQNVHHDKSLEQADHGCVNHLCCVALALVANSSYKIQYMHLNDTSFFHIIFQF